MKIIFYVGNLISFVVFKSKVKIKIIHFFIYSYQNFNSQKKF